MKGKGKGRGKGKLRAEGRRLAALEELVVAMANLQVANNNELKDMWGAMVRTAVLEDKSKITLAMKGAGKGYHKECKGRNPDEHKKGPPGLHVGSAMLSALLEEESITGQAKTDPKMAKELLESMPVDEAMLHIKMCKISKCWAEGKVKIQFHFSEKLEVAAWRALAMSGAVLKYGRAPQGALERALHRAVGEDE